MSCFGFGGVSLFNEVRLASSPLAGSPPDIEGGSPIKVKVRWKNNKLSGGTLVLMVVMFYYYEGGKRTAIGFLCDKKTELYAYGVLSGTKAPNPGAETQNDLYTFALPLEGLYCKNLGALVLMGDPRYIPYPCQAQAGDKKRIIGFRIALDKDGDGKFETVDSTWQKFLDSVFAAAAFDNVMHIVKPTPPVEIKSVEITVG